MKRVVIVGLGDTGLSCARFLAKKQLPFSVTDSRAEPPQLKAFIQEFPTVAVVTGGFSEELLNNASEIVVSPGVSLKEPVIAKQMALGKSVIGDIELFAREIKSPVIAITGSNGKTTVTTLVGEMMRAAGVKAAVCGNIGDPALESITFPEPNYYLMELSSFQLETTFSLRPKTATILNISQDHLDRYANMSEYTLAKQRIYQQCEIPVVNADEPMIWQGLFGKQRPLSFGLNNYREVDFSVMKKNHLAYVAQGGKPLIAVDEFPLQAPHHLLNALAALALGSAVSLSMDAMLSVLREFSGLPHRCQWVRKHQNVAYYNDSKGTNVGATISAIMSLGQVTPGKLILIAGGQGKGADFSPLKESVSKFVKELILIGEDAPVIEKALKPVVPITRAKSMEEAVEVAYRKAMAGDGVLLSPACASFDMFTNYEHRGTTFIKAVEAL